MNDSDWVWGSSLLSPTSPLVISREPSLPRSSYYTDVVNLHGVKGVVILFSLEERRTVK